MPRSARWIALLGIALVGSLPLACAEDDLALGEGTEPGQCEDGADNDGNGHFDCDDPGCAGAPACGGSNDAGDDGSNNAGDDGSNGDGGGSCVTQDDVVVAGSYDVESESGNSSECDSFVGERLVCQVSQDECSATTSCNIMGADVELTGDLRFRGGDNAHGYSGDTTVMGLVIDYDVEFRCASDPTCGFLDFAVVSIIVPANGLNCVFAGRLL